MSCWQGVERPGCGLEVRDTRGRHFVARKRRSCLACDKPALGEAFRNAVFLAPRSESVARLITASSLVPLGATPQEAPKCASTQTEEQTNFTRLHVGYRFALGRLVLGQALCFDTDIIDRYSLKGTRNMSVESQKWTPAQLDWSSENVATSILVNNMCILPPDTHAVVILCSL